MNPNDPDSLRAENDCSNCERLRAAAAEALRLLTSAPRRGFLADDHGAAAVLRAALEAGEATG